MGHAKVIKRQQRGELQGRGGSGSGHVHGLASVTAPLAWGLYSEHSDDCIIRGRGASVRLTGVVTNAIQAQRWEGPS